MKIKILKEAGYDEALLGLSLSYGTSPERGWLMFGIGWKSKWFLGLSIAKKINERA